VGQNAFLMCMADISSAIVYAHAVGVERFSKLVTKHAHHFAPQFFRGDAQFASWATCFDLRRATPAKPAKHQRQRRRNRHVAHSGFGFHSRARRCASAICAGVIRLATLNLYTTERAAWLFVASRRILFDRTFSTQR
jgi:hypothetical protein